MKLNIYGAGGAVVKTYEAETFRLKTGLCIDILEQIDIDKLTGGSLNETALGLEIIKLVAKNFNKFEPLVMDIFEGLTADEYRNTAIEDIADVIIETVMYTINKLSNIGSGRKKNK